MTGLRLAEEVKRVVEENPGLARISFVGHSLGGLIARYAIAVLYKDPSSDRGVDVTAPRGDADADTLSEPSQHGAQNLIEAEGQRLTDAPSSSTGSVEESKADSKEGRSVLEHLKDRLKIGSNGNGRKLDQPPSRVKSYSFLEPAGKVTIAGLTPVHFVTMATPHLGVSRTLATYV